MRTMFGRGRAPIMSVPSSTPFERLRRGPARRLLRAVLLLVAMLASGGPAAKAQFTRFENYTEEQGLGNLAVSALAQDHDGFLLLGTQGGLFRYDGTSFQQNSSGLPSDWMTEITTDGAGRLWVVTEEDGVFVGDGSHFDRIDAGAALNGVSLRSPHTLAATGDAMVMDVDGTLLRAPAGPGGVGHFAKLFDAATLAAEPVLAHARFVAPDADGGLLFGCGVALCRYGGGRLATFGRNDGLPADTWQTALRTEDGTLWVRSLTHLAWRRPGQARFAVVAVPGQHNSYFAGDPEDLQLLTDHRGGVLTQDDNGLLAWDGAAWQRYLPHPDGLPAAAIYALFWDREGSLWAGTMGYGAFRDVGLGRWEHWTAADGLPNSTVWGMARTANRQLWVATDGGSAALGAGTGVGGAQSYVAATTRAGRVWLAPPAGPLVRIDGDGHARAALPALGDIYQAVPDAANRLWLTSPTGLFLVPDADAPAGALVARLALSGRRCTVPIDPGGVVWAICRDGVFRLDRGGAFREVLGPSRLADPPVTGEFGSDGTFWMGTFGKGILRFRGDGERLDALPTISTPTIGDDTIMFLKRDRRGWMWVGTMHGIDCFDGRAWRHFGSSNGPISNDVDESAVLEDADGSMWFGTSHGLSHLIDPARLPPPPPLHPQITGVSFGRRGLPLDRVVRTAWSRDALVVRFVDLDYARRRGIAFRYRLFGVDTGWNDTTAQEARYTDLPAGKMRFELVATDAEHGAVSSPIGFTIRIAPPWWRRWWFFALCLLAGCGMLSAAWRTRVRLLLRQHRHLESVVSRRTAEIERAKDQLQRQAVELTRRSAELRRLALSDTLTGLANRLAIMNALEAALLSARAGERRLAVMICDIDHFKSINDTHGHLAGDRVLAEFGARIGAAVASPGAVGRYGGEEFLVILPGEADAIAREVSALHAGLSGARFDLGESEQVVTWSGGVAFLRRGDTAPSLLGRADAALYRAKANGRARIEDERSDPVTSTPIPCVAAAIEEPAVPAL